MCCADGKIAWIDLTSRTIAIESTQAYRSYLGGRSLGTHLVFREVPQSAAPLSPENILTFNTGPLTGTLAPTAGRVSVSTKNVATHGISFANAGGFFGPEMIYAGIDHLVIHGKSERPVYIYIHDNEIEIRAADHLWGRDTWETEERIRAELGDERVRVGAIGPAGENLVTMACIMFDRSRAAGWGGCGAVMGSKNLKALAVRGTGEKTVSRPESFMTANSLIWKRLRSTTTMQRFHDHGNLGTSGAGGLFGNLPQSARNMEDEVWAAEKTLKVREVAFREAYQEKKLACFACPITCSRFYHIRTGAFAGHKLEGLKTNAYRAFGTNVDVSDKEHILTANELADRYGLNCDSLSAVIAWAIDVYQRRLIDSTTTGGLELHWGDGELQLELIRLIAHREGFGDVLAKGVYRAAADIGGGTEQYAMHAKGHGICEQAMRSHKGWALGIVVSSKGGGHLSGAPNTEQRRLPPEVGERCFGVSTAGDPRSYEKKGKLVAWFEAYKVIADTAGVCLFSTGWTDTDFVGPEDFSSLISHATGETWSAGDLLALGERVCNIEKAFNTLHAGFTRDDDLPPKKLRELPVSSGEFAGEKLCMDGWNSMLDEYYAGHCWDVETGLQTYESLHRLGLQDIAEKLRLSEGTPSKRSEHGSS